MEYYHAGDVISLEVNGTTDSTGHYTDLQELNFMAVLFTDIGSKRYFQKSDFENVIQGLYKLTIPASETARMPAGIYHFGIKILTEVGPGTGYSYKYFSLKRGPLTDYLLE